MKGFILTILAVMCFSLQGEAQAANQSFATTNVNGNVNVYLTGVKEATIYQGVAGFVFETSHDAATIYFQGCYDTDDWRNIDTISASGSAVVDHEFYQAPPRYKSYRIFADGNVGDTCIITNARYYLKY
jgi:hypothetical protein